MMLERCVTLTKYQFSLDGEDFAEGYLVSEGDIQEGRLFRMGSLRCGRELPVPEGAFLEADVDNENMDGKLMFQNNRFLLSMRNRLSYQLQQNGL